MIYIGLGSNLSSSIGDRFKNIDCAINEIKKKQIQILKKSSYFESPSYPNKKNPKFINVVVSIQTKLSPIDLLKVLISIEEILGRIRKKKNDPRTCDIDVIDYNNQIMDIKIGKLSLKTPHKKIKYRNFVLYPLREIAPEWKHPETKMNINKLIEKLPDMEKKSILKVHKS